MCGRLFRVKNYSERISDFCDAGDMNRVAAPCWLRLHFLHLSLERHCDAGQPCGKVDQNALTNFGMCTKELAEVLAIQLSPIFWDGELKVWSSLSTVALLPSKPKHDFNILSGCLQNHYGFGDDPLPFSSTVD